MLHQKHSISKHSEHTLPFLLLKLSFPQQIETASHIYFIDSNQARRENEWCNHVNIQVIANTWASIVPENDAEVYDEAEEIDSHHSIPLHCASYASKYHHYQPRGKWLIQVKALIVLGDGFSRGQETNCRNEQDMEVMLWRFGSFVDEVQDRYQKEDHKGQDQVQYGVLWLQNDDSDKKCSANARESDIEKVVEQPLAVVQPVFLERSFRTCDTYIFIFISMRLLELRVSSLERKQIVQDFHYYHYWLYSFVLIKIINNWYIQLSAFILNGILNRHLMISYV